MLLPTSDDVRPPHAHRFHPAPARSGIGLAARHAGDKHVAAAQVANTGLVSLSYIQKISEKVGGLLGWAGVQQVACG